MSPYEPTVPKNWPVVHWVHDDSAWAPVVTLPYLPVPQLTQADSFVTPKPALHFPKKTIEKDKNSNNVSHIQHYFYIETRRYTIQTGNLRLPFGHPLQPLALNTASNSEYVPMGHLLHPSITLVALVAMPNVPLGQDWHILLPFS